ncbi:MAG: TrkA family potassium uptake protein [Stomatobaculum sp.]|nr:TrkA family potassium uptake protein [Stomatobaculum sp.]
MKNILLIGLGRFGTHIAKQLHALGHEVMAVDSKEEKVNRALPYVTDARIGDSANPGFLRSLGIPDYDVCIVAIGNDFQSSLETTALLKEMGAKYVVSRAEQDMQTRLLLRNGANEVVYPEEQMARWTAIRYSSDHILDFIPLDDKNSIFEISVPKSWIGHTVGELDIRKKYDLFIMAIRENGKMNIRVTPETVLTPDKTVMVAGEYRTLQRCLSA